MRQPDQSDVVRLVPQPPQNLAPGFVRLPHLGQSAIVVSGWDRTEVNAASTFCVRPGRMLSPLHRAISSGESAKRRPHNMSNGSIVTVRSCCSTSCCMRGVSISFIRFSAVSNLVWISLPAVDTPDADRHQLLPVPANSTVQPPPAIEPIVTTCHGVPGDAKVMRRGSRFASSIMLKKPEFSSAGPMSDSSVAPPGWIAREASHS